MFALVQQTFWQKNLVKSVQISALDKVIYYRGTFLQGSLNETSLYYIK
jgi:hypothetical protein